MVGKFLWKGSEKIRLLLNFRNTNIATENSRNSGGNQMEQIPEIWEYLSRLFSFDPINDARFVLGDF